MWTMKTCVVKSYNDRRGFGFLACTETADRFGRDVYMPKADAEATMAALLATGIDRETAVQMVNSGHGSPGHGGTGAASCSAALAALAQGPVAAAAAAAACEKKDEGEKSSAPSGLLGWGEWWMGSVGYPQAVCVQRLHKLTGTVVTPPLHQTGIISSEEARRRRVLCARVVAGVVVFDHDAGGQLRAIPGDVAESKIGVPPAAPPAEPRARMVCLASTDRAAGTVLGCFSLDLPRTSSSDDGCVASNAPNLRLPCHAFGDKLVLGGLPNESETDTDLEESELMKFFSKQGALNAIVAHAKNASFASVTFPGTCEVSRFLSRVAHAYADEKGTLIARLLPKEPSMESTATLPALPAPNLSTKVRGDNKS
eukprot:Skav211549  [mRNA]  locus=scaffold871:198123:207855:- [translate_table: standard]